MQKPTKPTKPGIYVPEEYETEDNPLIGVIEKVYNGGTLESLINSLKEIVDINDAEAIKTITWELDHGDIFFHDSKSRQKLNEDYDREMKNYQRDLPKYEKAMEKYKKDLDKWKIEQEAYLNYQLSLLPNEISKKEKDLKKQLEKLNNE